MLCIVYAYVRSSQSLPCIIHPNHDLEIEDNFLHLIILNFSGSCLVKVNFPSLEKQRTPVFTCYENHMLG